MLDSAIVAQQPKHQKKVSHTDVLIEIEVSFEKPAVTKYVEEGEQILYRDRTIGIQIPRTTSPQLLQPKDVSIAVVVHTR